MKQFMSWIKGQTDNNKLIRRGSLIWAGVLSTFATIVVYTSLEAVTAPVATVYGITIGLLGTVTKFYFDSRDRDDKRK